MNCSEPGGVPPATAPTSKYDGSVARVRFDPGQVSGDAVTDVHAGLGPHCGERPNTPGTGVLPGPNSLQETVVRRGPEPLQLKVPLMVVPQKGNVRVTVAGEQL